MNLLWLVFGGIFTAIEYLVASLLMMITIIGIPFGMQTLKMASLALWPFGKTVAEQKFCHGPPKYFRFRLFLFVTKFWLTFVYLSATLGPQKVDNRIPSEVRYEN